MMLGGRVLRSSPAVLLLLGAVVASATCAGQGDDGDADGGAGGRTTTALGGHDAGVGGAAGGGGAGATIACASDPCEVVLPQCGCADGERCAWEDGPVCVAAGAVGSSEACDDDCIAGYRCHNNLTGAPALCHRYCRQDEDCPGPGSLCTLGFGDTTVKLCSHNCDPVTDTGCDELVTKCGIFEQDDPPNLPFTQCIAAGSKGQGEECTNVTQCARGLSCFSITGETGSWCMTWCRTGAATSGCPQGTECGTFSPALIIGSVEYGACLAP